MSQTDSTEISPGALDHDNAVGPMGNFRWVICALLFFATTINYVDRQILSLLKETLDKELGWSNAQYGWANSLFQLSYGLSFIGFGWFIDRFGTKIGYAVSIGLWSVAAAGHGLVASVREFLVARVCLGFGEAGNFPSAIKATAHWFPKRERAFATSIFNSGASLAAVIAPVTIPVIAARWGWRSAFVFAGGAGFIWLIFWWLLYELPERKKNLDPRELHFILSDRDEAKQERRIRWSSIMEFPQAWSFIVAKFLTDPVWWFFLIWLPDFFQKTRGLDITHSMFKLSAIYLIITILSIVGGWLPGHLNHLGWSVTKARKTSMFIFACCVLPIMLVTHLQNIWLVVAVIGLAGAAHQAWSANLFTTVSDMFPKSAVASVTGLGGVAGSAGGFLFPILTGVLLDRFEKAHNATGGYAILFGICGFAYLVAFALHNLLAPKFEQINLPDQPDGFSAP